MAGTEAARWGQDLVGWVPSGPLAASAGRGRRAAMSLALPVRPKCVAVRKAIGRKDAVVRKAVRVGCAAISDLLARRR